MKKNNYQKGYTLVEILVSLGVLMGIMLVFSEFQRDVFFLNTNLQNNMSAQLDARHLVRTMITELRKTTNSATGGYPIELASTSEVAFFSDIDSNGSVEKVRYFLSGSRLRKGVTPPTGSPAVYNSANEVVTTLMNSVISSSTQPIFQFYSSSYDGTTGALSFPVDIPSIRLVRVTVIIDADPNRSPTQLIVTSSVALRNLKDNL